MAASKKTTNATNAQIVAKAIQFIDKATGEKPLGAITTTWPHLPTGSLTLNTLIGGNLLPGGKGFVCPGLPCQRMVEIYGAESSGKTTAALQCITSVQKAGGVAMFLDFENALHHNYAKAIGVSFDKDKLLYYAPTTLEQGLKMIYIAIQAGVSLIVVDSVSAMMPQSEFEKKLGDPPKIGALASAMSTNLPKIVQWLKDKETCLVLINQIRATISSTSKGDPDNTSGGKAVKFYASVRLKLTRIRSEVIERADPTTLKKKNIPYGNLVNIKVVKNKMDSKQGATGEVFIRYGTGIDEYISLIEAAVPRKIVTKNGATYGYGSATTRGREAFRRYLMENPKSYAEIQAKVTAAILAAAPETLSDDEADEADLIENMNRECSSDDQVYDGGADPDPVEEVLSEVEDAGDGE